MKKDNAEYEDWYAFAEDDLKFAQLGLREGFYSKACLHSQQAVEKALKGFLLFCGKMYPKTHSLVDLASLISEAWLEKHKKSLKILDEFYVPTRYPDVAAGKFGGLPGEKDAKEAVSLAEEVCQEILKNSFKNQV